MESLKEKTDIPASVELPNPETGYALKMRELAQAAELMERELQAKHALFVKFLPPLQAIKFEGRQVPSKPEEMLRYYKELEGWHLKDPNEFAERAVAFLHALPNIIKVLEEKSEALEQEHKDLGTKREELLNLSDSHVEERDKARRELAYHEGTPVWERIFPWGEFKRKLQILKDQVASVERASAVHRKDLIDTRGKEDSKYAELSETQQFFGRLERTKSSLAMRLALLPDMAGEEYLKELGRFDKEVREKMTSPESLDSIRSSWEKERKRLIYAYPAPTEEAVNNLLKKIVFLREESERRKAETELRNNSHESPSVSKIPSGPAGIIKKEENIKLSKDFLSYGDILTWQELKKIPEIKKYFPEQCEMIEESAHACLVGVENHLWIDLREFYPDIPFKKVIEYFMLKLRYTDFSDEGQERRGLRAILEEEARKLCPHPITIRDTEFYAEVDGELDNLSPNAAVKLHVAVYERWLAFFKKNSRTSIELNLQGIQKVPPSQMLAFVEEKKILSSDEIGRLVSLCHFSQAFAEQVARILTRFVGYGGESDGEVNRLRNGVNSFGARIFSISEALRTWKLEHAFSEYLTNKFRYSDDPFKFAEEALVKWEKLISVLQENKDEKFIKYATCDTAMKLVSGGDDLGQSIGMSTNSGYNLEKLTLFLDSYADFPESLDCEELRNVVFLNPYLSGPIEKKDVLLAKKNQALYKEKFGFEKSDKFLSLIMLSLAGAGLYPGDLPELLAIHAPLLMKDQCGSEKWWLPDLLKGNAGIFQDDQSVKILDDFFGRYGQPSKDFLEGYAQAVREKVITRDEVALCHELLAAFKVLTPSLLASYKEAKKRGEEALFLSELTDVSDRMTSGKITEEERGKSFYKDLLIHVFPNNAGSWTTRESNATCKDRSEDLAQFIIRPKYTIDLFAAGEIKLKEGSTLQEVEIAKIREKISESSRFSGKTELGAYLDKEINRLFDANLSLKDLQVSGSRDRLALLLISHFYGESHLEEAGLKKLLMEYYFAAKEDFQQYAAGTSDRVGAAKNRDYSELCEFDTFYRDNMKELSKVVIADSLKTPIVGEFMKMCFEKQRSGEAVKRRKTDINKLQVDKLALSGGFLKQMQRALEARSKKPHSPEQTARVIELYERFAQGLSDKESLSAKKGTKAFYGQLKAQRDKTAKAMEIITGETVQLSDFHVGEVNLQELLDTELNIIAGAYNKDQFAAYTIQKVTELFAVEREFLESELEKFVSGKNEKRELVNAYITKTAESANARMVGGVCVSGDNPAKNEKRNLWNMPNYFQMVFQSPNTNRCVGLALLHHFEEDGKKVLTASLNPSSTYLYTVDEKALFEGIMKQLETFATENEFDKILLSKNKTIRTNRTGGLFERAIDQRVVKLDTKHPFKGPVPFSYNPTYNLQEMDVVWAKQ